MTLDRCTVQRKAWIDDVAAVAFADLVQGTGLGTASDGGGRIESRVSRGGGKPTCQDGNVRKNFRQLSTYLLLRPRT